MQLAAKMATDTRALRRLSAYFLPLVLAVSSLSAISVVTAPSAKALSNADCVQTVGTAGSVTATAVGNDCLLVFSADTTWTIPTGVTSIKFLLVGGGASGRWDGGGGGGGGGGLEHSGRTVTPGTVANIDVGAGGSADATAGGSDSQLDIDGTAGFEWIAKGGAIGTGWARSSNNIFAEGGLGGVTATQSGATALTGGKGGQGPSADGAGVAASNTGLGNGFTSSITGTTYYYGGGGGGGIGAHSNNNVTTTISSAAGGFGGGGAGATQITNSIAATNPNVSIGYRIDGTNSSSAVELVAKCNNNSSYPKTTTGWPGLNGYGGGGGGGAAYGDGCSNGISTADDGERTRGGNGGNGVVIVRYTFPVAPDAPTITRVVSTATTAAITYAAPVSAGTNAITGYQFEISTNNGSTWSSATCATNVSNVCTITGLTISPFGLSRNQYRVKAVSSAGTSPASASANGWYVNCATPPVPQLGNGDYNYLKEAVSVITFVTTSCNFLRSITNFVELGTAGSGAQTFSFDPNSNASGRLSVSSGVFWTDWTLLNNSLPTNVPTFGTASNSANSATIQVSNFDSSFSYSVSGSGCTAAINSSTGLISATSYTNLSCSIKVTTSKTGFAQAWSTAYVGGNRFSVSFQGNSNTGGSMSAQIDGSGATLNLTPNAFVRTGYTFSGWNTENNGTGTAYADQAPYAFTANIVLRAQWTAITNNAIVYDNQGATTSQSGGSTTYTTASAIATIPTNAPLKTGYTFAGWYTAASGGTQVTNGSYSPPSPYGTVTLYAQWTANTNNAIVYDNQGATSAQSGGSATYTTAAAISAIPTTAPQKTGFNFAGWFTAATGGTQVTNGSYTPPSPYGSVTLYAQWSCNPTSSTSSAPGYTVVTFSAVGTCNWSVPAGVTDVRVLTVGGGGGGGAWSGAGGGAGGFIDTTTSISGQTTVVVTVGDGGAGAQYLATSDTNYSTTRGSSGGDSKFGALPTAVGGGKGATHPYGGSATGTASDKPSSGGSGGGGTGSNGVSGLSEWRVGKDGTASQGNKGADGSSSAWGPTGGGGGAGGAGSGIYGGAGLASDITGTSTLYAGGGGGVNYAQTTPNTAGSGGGGSGGSGGYTAGGNGSSNTGGGGGGGNQASGGKGGSGVVIVRYVSTVTITPTRSATSMVYGTSSNWPTASFTTSPSVTLATQPTCSFYASSDSSFATPVTLSATTPAGSYVVKCTGGSYSGATISYGTNPSFTITKGTSGFSISGGSFTYNGNPQGPSSISNRSGSNGSVTYEYTGRSSTSYGPSSTRPSAVGTYTATATVADDSNFAGVSASVDFEITTASLVVTPTITASSMVYGTSGASLPTISYTKSPDVNLTTNPTCALYLASDTGFVTAQTLSSTLAVGTYVVRCAGAALTNYTITYGTNPTFSVTQVTLAQPNAPSATATAGVLKSIAVTWSAVTNAVSYSLKMYASNGTTLLATIAVASGTSKTVTASDYASIENGTDYKFTITAIGNSTYADSTASSLSSTVTTNSTYTITYAAGTSGTGSAPVTPTSVIGGATFTTPANTYSRTGFTFGGWSDGTNTYAASATYPSSGSVSANVTLTATWTGNALTISYDSQSGSLVSNGATTSGGVISSAPVSPTRTGYTFLGWSTTSSGSVVTFPYTHGQTSNFTLYAIWQLTSCSPTTPTVAGYAVYIFTVAQTCTWTVPNGVTDVEILAVGAGGGGGFAWDNAGGGGGGAGQVKTGTGTLATTVEVTVGSGGSGGTTSSRTGSTGGSSSVGNTITALGGTGGCPRSSGCSGSGAQATSTAAGKGGSGGGGGNSGTGGGGNAGGGTVNAGGAGVASNYSGSSVTYGAGGAGGTPQTSSNIVGPDGAANTGNGGDGASAKSSSGDVNGGAGGSGIIIIRSPNVLTITYDSQSGSPVSSSTTRTGASISAAPSAPSKSGYVFAGWSTTVNGTVISFPYTHSQTSSFTLYAVWTAITYSITFYDTNSGSGGGADGGTAPVTQTGSAVASVNLNNNTLSLTGYTFAGWATSNNSSTVAYANQATVSLTANTTLNLYPVWTAGNNTVTFNANDGSGTPATSTQTIVSGTATALTLNTFSRTGYTFAGWTANANGTGTSYTDGQSVTITSGFTVYAKWTAANNTIVFNSNGGTGTMSNQTIVTATATSLTSNTFTRPGYTFAGWNTNADGSTGTNYSNGQSVTINAGFTAYAKWTKVLCSITGSTSIVTGFTTYKFTESCFWTNTTGKTAFDIAVVGGGGGGGWGSRGGGGGAGQVVVSKSAKTIDANAEILIIVGAGGAGIPTSGANPGNNGSSSSVTIGSTVLVTAIGGGGGAGDATLTGKAGGSGGGGRGATTTGTSGGSAETQATLTSVPSDWNVYANSGGAGGNTNNNQWYGGGGGGAGGSAPAGGTGGIGISIWDSSNLKVGGGGQGFEPVAVADQSTAASFGGGYWPSGSSFTCPSTGSNRPCAGVANTGGGGGAANDGGSGVVLLRFANANTVTFKANDGGSTADVTQTITSGAATTLTANTFARTGYTFAGWNTNADGTSGTNYTDAQSVTVSSGLTLFAKWTANSLPITYDSQGGTSVTAGSVNTGASIASAPTAPTKAGFTLTGWSTTSSGSVITYPYVHGQTAGFTLYAIWSANALTITYNSQGGSSVTAGSVNTGASISSAPTAPTRDGYTFSGWSTTSSGSTISFPFSHGQTANFTLYAIWAANALTVTYDSQGGSSVSAGTVNTGAKILLAPTAPTRSGFYFFGWSTTSSGQIVDFTGGYSHGQTSNFTLYAIWTPAVETTGLRINLDASNRDSLPTNSRVWRSIAPGFTNVATSSSSSATTNVTITTNTTPGFATFPTASDGFQMFTAALNGGASIPGTSGVSVEAWIKLADNYVPSSTIQRIATHWFDSSTGQETNDSKDWNFRIVDGRFSLLHSDGPNNSNVQSDIVINQKFAGQWIHVGFTWTASGAVRFYLNGAPVGSEIAGRARSASRTVTTAQVTIGCSPGGFIGSISKLRVYEGALSPSQILSNFNNEFDVFGLKKITFSANDGSGTPSTATQWVPSGTSKALDSNAFTRTGYTFAGWTGAADGTGTSYTNTQSISITSPLTIYAKWTAGSNTVTFNANDGSGTPATSTQSITSGTATALTTNSFTRTGYTFAGWTANANGTGTAYTDGQSVTITAGFTVYAKWTANTNTFAYDGNGSDGGSTPSGGGTKSFASTITVAANTYTRTGWTFVAWNTAADGSGTEYVATNTFSFPNAAVTLYAQWTKIKTTGLLVNLDATNPQSASGNTTWVNARPGTSVSSQNGVGVTFANNGGIKSFLFDSEGDHFAYTTVADTRFSGAMSLEMWIKPGTLQTGTWNIIASNWFSDNVNSQTESQDWHFAIKKNSSSEYKLNLYTTGDPDLYGSRNFTSNSEWVLVGFTLDASGNLKFYVNGVQDGNTITSVDRTARTNSILFIGEPRNLTPDGGFLGNISKFRLYTNALSASEMASNFDAEYEYYGLKKITFNANDGSGTPATSIQWVASGTSTALASNTFTRTGYTFAGWTGAADGTGTSYTNTQSVSITSPLTIYAKWTANGNAVVFNNNNGSGTMSNQSITSGTATALTSNTFTRTGYTFSGWNTAANGSGTAYTDGQSVTLTAGMTIYAQWTGTTNTITYDSKGGSSVANGSFVTGGSVASAPTAPTRAGYTLTGWSETDGGSVVTYPYSPTATSGITLYAVWSAISCSPTSTTTGGYTIYTFTTVGTCFWTVPNGVTDVEVLTVAGGGGGGYAWDNTGAGGGAGGQVKTGTATLSTTVQVTVGAGGAGGTTSSRRGGTGSDSAFGTLTALGGTGGCSARSSCSNSAQATSLAAANGGLGGIGGASGRGGGGSNVSGTTTSTTAGGAGTASNYSGTSVTYGAGGSGGSGGSASNSTGTTATANTGNGGGGATAKSASGDVNGGAGASGLVIVRVASALTVTFDSQSGSSVSNGSTVTGGTLTAPTAPTRSNYTFLGWSTTSNGSVVSFSGGYAHGQTADFTLYARWALNTYAITFNANNGSGTMGNQTVTHGVAVALNPNLFTRANYVFYRWATAADGTGTTYNNLADITLTAGATLYAQWTANTYVVTFAYNSANGGNTTTTSSFTTGGTAITMPVPTRTGYTFGGWYAASDLSGTAIGSTYSPTGTTLSLTAYAKWTAVDYTFTYNSNSAGSGTVPTETSKQIGQIVTIKANTGSLIRDGYTFAGWNTASNGGGTNYLSGSQFTVESSNVTLYAKWTANTYTVTYNSNGGSGSAQRSSSNVSSDNYTTGGTAITLPDAGTLTRTGYTFAGWNTSANGTGSNYNAAASYTTMSTETLYAKWTPNTYSITYNANGGTGTAPTTGSYVTGQASPYVVLANTYTNSTSVFGGWNTAANGTGTSYSVGATFTTLADVTLYAVWIPRYTLHYAVNGGTVKSGFTLPADALLVVNTVVNPLFNGLERTGYTFAGWTNGSTNIAPNGSFTIVEDSVLTARWTPIDYTITFVSAGGSSAPAPTTKQIGQSYTLAAARTKPGHTFSGWRSGAGTTYGAGASLLMGSDDIEFTAQWTPDVYQVSYDWNGGRGTAVNDVSYTFGNPAITLPVVGDRVKDGYTFAGWAESANGSALGLTYTPSQTRTLYALWNLGNFTVTYDAGRGTVANSSVAVQNGSATVLPLPTRSNFVFDGWHTATTGGSRIGNNGASFTPAASQTLYARWIQSSLYGISDSLTRIGSVITADNVSNTFSGANSNSSVTVSVPANAFAAGTTINFDLVGNSSRATGLISGINYIVSIAVSWLTGDETVPDTAAGKSISVTITNASIKAGAAAYAIVNNVSTLLGTATQDGSITVQLTSDPEIVVAATKPSAPTSVSASSNGNQQSVISWSAPTSDGGSAITGYTVTANTGATCTTSTTSCTISSLTNGTAYTFTVTATNTVGTSVASSAASATTASVYAVAFDAKGGSSVTAGSFLTASTVSEPTAPTRAGYAFAGWAATDGGTVVTFPYAPGVTTNITMYARWDALDHVVTFDSKSGSSVANGVFASGGTVAEPTAPTRSGYTFAGWSATDGGASVSFPYSPGVVTDITLYAKWSAASSGNSGSSGNSSSGSPSSAERAPTTPVKSNVTVVAPVTVVGNDAAKVIAVEIKTSTDAGSKPPAIKIDAASDKFIAEVKVEDGKLVLTPEVGFSGRKTVTVTITENGADRIVQIPLTVLPEPVAKPVVTPAASTKSVIRWTESPNADGYTVFVNGKRVCVTDATSCSLKTILGPKSEVVIVSNGGDRTVSQKVEADFRQNTPVQIARVVSSTNIKTTLSKTDLSVLNKAIATIRTQGFGTVVISEISTTKKTQALADARLAAIKKYIDDKLGSIQVAFEVVPPATRTYFNNISVKG